MLLRLALEEFVIVERGVLEFAPGLNVLTGETGAGKSILIDALGFLAGGRASSDWLRRGAARLAVEAEIRLDPDTPGRAAADRLGIPLEEQGSLLIRREFGADGRSRCFANGRQLLVAQLRELTEGALWIVGQGEQRALTTSAEQEWLLDRFAGAEKLRTCYRDLRARFLAQVARSEEIAREREAFLREEDWLRFQVREIREAEMVPGERDRLREARRTARETLEESGLRAELETRLFEAEGSILDHLETLCHRLSHVEGEQWNAVSEEMRSLRERVRDLRGLVPRGPEEIDLDPDAIDARLQLIDRLARKYGGRTPPEGAGAIEEAILAHLAEAEARLEAGEALGHEAEACAGAVEDLRRSLAGAGAELSALRREAGARFAAAASSGLDGLGMQGASLAFRFRSEPDPDGVDDLAGGAGPAGEDGGRTGGRIRPLENGLERVSLCFRSHPAEPEGDLGRIASGGELSRVLLAIHAALGEAGPPGCWVLDEVDAGIGGETASRVGLRLQKMALRAQVLLVTHLPGIAARAGRHLRVVKEEREGRPAVRIETLSGEDRLGELARMLSGDPSSSVARIHARELLALAAKAGLSG